MSSDSDVIVINDELDVQTLRNRKSGSFGVIAFLLRTIRAETEDGLITVGEGYAVDQCPVFEREFDSWGVLYEQLTTCAQVAPMKT